MSEKKVLKISGSSPTKETAGSIAKTYFEDGISDIELRAIGASAVCQMFKAMATARSIFAMNGRDLSCNPGYSEVTIDGNKKTVMVSNLIIK